MSRLSDLKKQAKPGVDLAITHLRTMVQEQGNTLSDAKTVKSICSMESLDTNVAFGVQQSIGNIEESLRDIFLNSMGVSAEEFNENQIEAAAIIMAATGDLTTYSAEAYKDATSFKGDSIEAIGGQHGNYDYQNTLSISAEAFSEQELRANLPLSVAYNFLASRQNEFGEAFFPTQTLTPDQAALLLKVRKYNVYEQVRHAVTGAKTDFKFHNLVEAARDYTILANEATAIIPIFTGTNDSAWSGDGNYAYFMEDAYISGGFSKVINGTTVASRPLRPKTDLDLLGISQDPGLIGLADSSDAIDANVTLGAIYIAVHGTVSAVEHTEVFKFNTSRLPRAGFNKTHEGNYREIGLQFSTETLFLDSDTKTIANASSALLAGMAADSLKLVLSTEVAGRINTETGRTNCYGSGVNIVKVVDADGVEVSLGSGEGAALAGFDYTFVGYDLSARRSNANRRNQGLLASPTEEEDRYVIPLGSPITSTSPIGTNRDAADLQTLVNMTRVRNSNNAVTTLLNYADTLNDYVANAAAGVKGVVQGIGRHLVTPFYELFPLDLQATVNSLTSNQRYDDVSAAMVNTIRELAARMVQQSGYLQALDIISGGQDMGFEVVIGTDQYISRFLMVTGDNRTLGNGMDCVIVTTPDSRMDNKIAISLRRKNVQGYDPLTFGSMAYIPELASAIQATRNGAIYKEATVQPRTMHIPVLPVMAMIEVSGLKEILTENVPLNANVLP